MNTEVLSKEIDTIIANKESKENKLQAICDYLESEISYYDWVGFYFINGNKQELKLAQYTGEETEHTIIPFGKGICGQDVAEQDNYISCGWKVKSEIVIPIFVDGENIGQIDIDSHTANTFTEKDEELLEYVCKQVATLF